MEYNWFSWSDPDAKTGNQQVVWYSHTSQNKCVANRFISDPDLPVKWLLITLVVKSKRVNAKAFTLFLYCLILVGIVVMQVSVNKFNTFLINVNYDLCKQIHIVITLTRHFLADGVKLF